MSKRKTTEEFIAEAAEIHNNFYTYTHTAYKDAVSKVVITCPIHGDFLQKPNSHLQGNGCKQCGIEKAHKPTRKTFKDFCNEANMLHSYRYKYIETSYKSASAPLDILCPIHGKFTQHAMNHLTGKGCKYCGIMTTTKKQTSTVEDFIKKSRRIHKNFYSYENSIYTTSKDLIKITCPIHGGFEQTSNRHLNGQGCPDCAKAAQGWSWSAWEQQGVKSTQFDSFKMYIIECWDDIERFYKIGKTFHTIGRRFDSIGKLPYSWKVISTVEGDARTISQLELQKHTELGMYSYTPKVYFQGNTECFSCYELL
jgi:hypothetical protein